MRGISFALVHAWLMCGTCDHGSILSGILAVRQHMLYGCHLLGSWQWLRGARSLLELK